MEVVFLELVYHVFSMVSAVVSAPDGSRDDPTHSEGFPRPSHPCENAILVEKHEFGIDNRGMRASNRAGAGVTIAEKCGVHPLEGRTHQR